MNKQYTSEKRKPIIPPDKIVDEKGDFNYGTYSKPFKNLNMLDAKLGIFPHSKFYKKMRLKDWEAIEVIFDSGFLVCAVYRLGPIGFNVMIYYDKKSQKCVAIQSKTLPNKIKTHSTLIDSVKQLIVNDKNHLTFNNNFEKGKVDFKGSLDDGKNSFNCDFNIQEISTPSNVCIPFGNRKSLYSHKSIFKAEGYFVLNGKEYKTNENSLSIIDDHKGYYPYNMKYYWVTTMGDAKIDDREVKIGLNLTENQTIDPYNYNENILWLEGEGIELPPAHFTIEKENLWTVKDENNNINIKFEIEGWYKLKKNLGLILIDYKAPFGKVSGTIKLGDGRVYKIENQIAMGEDKHYKI